MLFRFTDFLLVFLCNENTIQTIFLTDILTTSFYYHFSLFLSLFDLSIRPNIAVIGHYSVWLPENILPNKLSVCLLFKSHLFIPSFDIR